MTKKDIKIEKAKQIHGNKYDYSEWPDNVINSDKLPITCKEHNVRFIQNIKSHLKGSSGCHKCTIINKPKTRDERIQEVEKIHKGKYDYSGFPHSNITGKSKVKIRCIKHNIIFEQEFARHARGSTGCNRCIDEKRTKTNIERFGHKCTLHHEDIKEKTKKTWNEKYGCDNPFGNEEIKNKIRNTNIKKYGCDNPSSSEEIKEKKKQTSLLRYGVANHLKDDNIKRKIKQTNIRKYGVEFATQKHISKQTWDNLNDKQWMYDQHVVQEKSLLQMAKELQDVGDSMVGRYMHNHGIDTKMHSRSQAEKEVGEFISNLGVPIKTNIRDIISPYELDIYIPEHNLAIEYCGLFWHSEQAGKHRNYHKLKYDMCKEEGIHLITIFEDEWEERKEQVKSKLMSMLHQDARPRIYARTTDIVVVTSKIKSTFFDENHIQGDGPSSVNIGLTYNGELIACMGFIKQKEKTYLNRYATSAHVIGGFSKLLKHFQNNYEWDTLISFADLRWSTGNLYEKTDWKLDKILNPDYSYSPPESKRRYHKFNFRRKQLATMLENFDESLGERENCDNHNILRIWDCGKQRWIIKNPYSKSMSSNEKLNS